MDSTEPQARTALERMRRDIQSANSLRRTFKDYGTTAALTPCCAYIAWLSAPSEGLLFFGMLVIVLSFHGVSEQRAERRHKLLLDALQEIGNRVSRKEPPQE